MSRRVLEAVPNFSEGRDLELVRALVSTLDRRGTEVLDWSADPDHHRSVVTLVGEPAAIEDALVEAAYLAAECIDLRSHRGVHPRIGALDVLPLVPLVGLDMDDAVRSAHRLGQRLATEVGLPVYYYAAASRPPGRRLATLRGGGFEALAVEWPEERPPDELPPDWAAEGAHPTAGVTCVGARELLLAWNVYLEDVALDAAASIAASIRERGGGFHGLRALALSLPEAGRVQISMNLEDLDATRPLDVYDRIDRLAREAGGRAAETEIIGMMPDQLLLSAAADRLRLRGAHPGRLLSRRLSHYLTKGDDWDA